MTQFRSPIANCRLTSRILAAIVFAVGASAFAVEAFARVGGGQSYGGGGGGGGGGGAKPTTSTGIELSFVVPSPSWPNPF